MIESIAHIRSSDETIQTIEEHLMGVKELAEQYGEKIGIKHIAGLAGMLHDLGKYTSAFTNYIKLAVYYPDEAPSRGSVDHSTAGGKLLYEYLHRKENTAFEKILAEVVGNAIISHHSYLHDYLHPTSIDSPFLSRVRDKEIEEFPQAKHNFFRNVISEKKFLVYIESALDELFIFLRKSKQENLEFTIMFLTKFVFSCLIDADRTNTRQFVEGITKNNKSKTLHDELFKKYYEHLSKRLLDFKHKKDADSKINQLRKQMSIQCEKAAYKPSNIYTLSIPTGGGKTLASFRYALKHALKYDKERIIYIVPYTTIIEQNAQDIREMIQDDVHLLEHHSNVMDWKTVNDGDFYEDEKLKKLMLAKDNWDSPIIFTTMVQFLNVFYNDSSQNIRRLHNLANSVIIFDEVQKVPLHTVSLFNHAVNFLHQFAQSSILLCTATQPALNHVKHHIEMEENNEIIKNLPHISKAFERVEIIDRATSEQFDNEKLLKFVCEELDVKDSVLVVLNTKSVVRDLYKKLNEQDLCDVSIYHLSTSMCAAHRKDILRQVKKDLKNNKKVICISTQLIEAGVDISFDSVIRSLAGLDSIAQAAGRCNRHGEKAIRQVYVIDHIEENLDKLIEIKKGKEITKKILIDIKRNSSAHGGNLLSPEAMEFYFLQLYNEFRYELDYPINELGTNLSKLLGSPLEKNPSLKRYVEKHQEKYSLLLGNSYRTAAEYFEVIENHTTTVLVPYEKGKDYIAKFNSFEYIEDLTKLLKESQHYTVNLYEQEIEELKMKQQIESLQDGVVLVLHEGAYDKDYGVNIKGDSSLDFSLI